ncbi:myo-inosose-2 dehydratase [Shewanella surugensis]|uniref:Myo-inosose-2 dehydratase n=1 Tax=Shewanella surugensis TaxID=212020 RepID=A0ABT0LHX8_9GAMM|nr:myo-inosose-2 dehydratase [Shewanella surugensis]MCL1127318.1 myo-inosose-2 dehydratase [Shewanella surugensis]
MSVSKYKIGIAPINWTNDDDPNLGGDIPFDQCIFEMSESGYIGTEVGNKYPRDIKQLKAALEPLNLQISSAWYSTFFTEEGRHQETLSAFMDQLSFLSNSGAKYITVAECGHCIQSGNLAINNSNKPTFTTKQWDNLIQGLHQLGRIAYDYGMTVVYHYHMGTGIQNQDEIDYLMKHTSPELISLLMDTGHAYFAGIDPVTLIKQYKDRIKYVHLKDIRNEILKKVKADNLCFMDGIREGVFTVPGDGDLDFKQIFKTLDEIDYRGWMIVEAEQDPAKANPKKYAKQAREFIKFHTGE